MNLVTVKIMPLLIDDDHYEISPDSSSRCTDAKDGDDSLDELGYVIEGILSPEVEEAITENSIRGTTSQGTIPEVMNSPKCIKTVGEVETEDIHDIEVSPQNNDQTSNSTNAKLEKSSEKELSELPDNEDDKTNHQTANANLQAELIKHPIKF